MGSRTDNFVGLNDRACELVAGDQVLLHTDVVHRTYPSGETVVLGPQPIYGRNVIVEQYATMEGAFYNEFPLFKYTFEDGRVLYEYVQASPWSSGPWFLTALRDGDGNPVPESLWTDEEIASYE